MGTEKVRIRRSAVAVGLAVFIALTGTGVASATWTTTNSSLAASSSAGALTVTQSGVDGLTKVYAPGDLVDYSPIVIKNTGTVPATYTFQLKGQTPNTLTSAVTVIGWAVASAAGCTATVPGSGTVSASLSAGISWPSPAIAVGETQILCIRTSITSTEATAASVDTAVAIGTVSASVGSWTSTSTASAQQTVARDTVAPTVPANLAATSVGKNQVTLGWSASSDAYGVAGYRIYRAGAAVATTTARTFTDSGRSPGTAYLYTVRAYDAAGNESANSNTVSATTSAASYLVTNPNSGLCLSGEGGATTSGTRLVTAVCSTSQSQAWQFIPTSNGYFKVVPGNAPSLGWTTIASDGLTTSQDYARVAISIYVGDLSQQWMPVSEGESNLHFVNRLTQKCLDINGAGTAVGTRLQQYTCNNTVAQTFTRVEVN